MDAFGRYVTEPSGYLLQIAVGRYFLNCADPKKYMPEDTKKLVSPEVTRSLHKPCSKSSYGKLPLSVELSSTAF